MKIVEIQKFGGPEVLQIIEEADTPPQAGQVAVDVKAAGINFADLMARSGRYPLVSSTPYRPGFEVAGVGSLAVQIAKLKGAGKVIGLASPSKHERVRSLGADAALDYTQSGWSKQVLAETGGKGVDIYIDAQGDLSSEGFDALGQKAHWLVYGGQAQSGSGLPPERIWSMVGKNISLRGYSVYGDVSSFGRALPEMFAWATSGKLQIDVESFALDEVAQAHEAIAQRKTTGKVVLVP